MRAFLILASLSVLVAAEPPTGYTHRSSSPELNFQPVPSVAQIHIPPSASPRSSSVSSSSNSGLLSASSTSQVARYAVPPATLTVSAPSHHHHHQHQETAYSSPQASYAAPSSSQSQPTYSAPSSSQSQPTYSAPASQQTSYGLPQQSVAYSTPQTSYSSPQLQSYAYPQVQIQTQYASPSQQQQYSLPPQQYASPNNVQVNYGAPPPLPPGASYGPPPMVTGAGPDHNIEYRVVYVKGPKAPKPDLILPPAPPKQKTIVYILIPRVDPPEPIIVPTHPPTPPSKPEVYFIRYKSSKKNKQASSSLANSVPSSNYGAPFGSASGPKPVIVEAPTQNRKRSTESASATTARPTTTTTSEPAIVSTAQYGERVRKLH